MGRDQRRGTVLERKKLSIGDVQRCVRMKYEEGSKEWRKEVSKLNQCVCVWIKTKIWREKLWKKRNRRENVEEILSSKRSDEKGK